MKEIEKYEPMPIKDRAIVIGTILKSLRKEKQLTQKEVGEYLKVSKPTYANYEYGRNEPNIETLIQLAYFYDVSMDFITGKVLSKPMLGDIQGIINAERNPLPENSSEEIRQLREENKRLHETIKGIGVIMQQMAAAYEKNPNLLTQIIDEELKKQ